MNMPLTIHQPEPAIMSIEAVEDEESSSWRPKSWPVRLWYGVCAVLEWLFGLVSLLATLALLAAIPIMNLIALGYLLDASGRVAKSGRVRDGFVDIGKFAR